MKDIFNFLEENPCPSRVFIVGGGPNGKDAINEIPEDAFTIAVNSLITHKRAWTWWLAFDKGIENYPWWPGLKIPEKTKVLFGHTLADVSLIVPDYTFRFEPTLAQYFRQRNRKSPLMEGVLRGSASIIGCAIQFAYFLGAEEIVLCGVDMFGQGHWDGFMNPRNDHKGVWGVSRKVQWLIDSLKTQRGMEISTMSKTALNVPDFDRKKLKPKSRAEGIVFPPGADFNFAEIEKWKDFLDDENEVLLVGGGPSGAAWEDYCDCDTPLMVCNSAIIPTADRADFMVCTESSGWRLPWTRTKTNATKFLSYKAMAHLAGVEGVPVERSWHLAGFDPREYFNNRKVPDKVWNSDSMNLYKKHKSWVGMDSKSRREWGLIKGPLCYPFNMSIGTVLLNALHLLAYMGARHVTILGFELHMGEGQHWAEPEFEYVSSKWAPKECFINVNGMPTMWHFAMSAAYVNQLKRVFKEAGMTWTDKSGGLLSVPGIESLMDEINNPPKDFEV